MEEMSFHLDVISGVESLYNGRVRSLRITGSEGELGIRHGHAPLLTTIKAGTAIIVTADGKEDQMYLAGGVLEVQPDNVTVLADTALRADDIDEAKVQEAMKTAQQIIANNKVKDNDYTRAFAQLAEAMAQLKVVELSRRRRK